MGVCSSKNATGNEYQSAPVPLPLTSVGGRSGNKSPSHGEGQLSPVGSVGKEKDTDPHSDTDTNGARAEADLHAIVPILSPPINSLLAATGGGSTKASPMHTPFSPTVTGGSFSLNSKGGLILPPPIRGESAAARPRSHSSAVQIPNTTFIEAKAGQEHTTASLHTDGITDLCLTDVDSEILSCSDDKSISLYSFKTKSQERWSHHSKGVTRVLWSNRLRQVFSGSRDSTIRQWRRGAFRELQCFRGHTLPISALALSSSAANNSSILLSGARDYTIRTWNVETAQQLSMITLARNVVTGMKWIGPVGCSENNAGFGAKSVEDARINSGGAGAASTAITSPLYPSSGSDPYCFLQSSEDPDQSVRIWDVRSMEVVASFPSDGGKIVRSMQSDPIDSNRFVVVTAASDLVGGGGGEIRLWDRRMAASIGPASSSSSSSSSTAATDAEPLLTVLAHSDSINSVAFLPVSANSTAASSTHIVTASKDRTLKVWDLSSAGAGLSRCTQVVAYKDLPASGKSSQREPARFAGEFTALALAHRPITTPTSAWTMSNANSPLQQQQYVLYSATSYGMISAWGWNPTKPEAKLELIAQTKPCSSNQTR